MLRIIGVTLLVSAVGAVAGAAVGALVMAILVTIFGGSPELSNIVAVGAAAGSVIGGLLSPLMTWLFLRRVPLWRASVEIGAAATFGFMSSLIVFGGLHAAYAVASSLGFALLAVARLKFASRRRGPAIEAP